MSKGMKSAPGIQIRNTLIILLTACVVLVIVYLLRTDAERFDSPEVRKE